MTGRCVVCGIGKMVDKITEWVKCDHCSRWTHIPCTKTDENNLFDDSIHFFCLIFTRVDLRSNSNDVHHFETFSQAAGKDTLDDSEDDAIGIENDGESAEILK